MRISFRGTTSILSSLPGLVLNTVESRLKEGTPILRFYVRL